MKENDSKDLNQILAELEAQQPEIDRILNRPPIIDTGRKKKMLEQVPADLDFVTKDGNTVYEVIGHFDPDAGESIFDRIIRCLGYSFSDTD